MAIPDTLAAEPMVGAWGTVAAVSDAGDDARLVPAALVAVTVNEYVVPAVRPEVMVHDVPVVVQVPPPVLAVTVYPVTAVPPLALAVHETVACGGCRTRCRTR